MACSGTGPWRTGIRVGWRCRDGDGDGLCVGGADGRPGTASRAARAVEMPRTFAAAGYRTAAIGKDHFGWNATTNHGIDHGYNMTWLYDGLGTGFANDTTGEYDDYDQLSVGQKMIVQAPLELLVRFKWPRRLLHAPMQVVPVCRPVRTHWCQVGWTGTRGVAPPMSTSQRCTPRLG